MQKYKETEGVYEKLIIDRPSYLILRFIDKFGDECYKDNSSQTYNYALRDMEEIFREFIDMYIQDQNIYIYDQEQLRQLKEKELSNLKLIIEVIMSREYDQVIQWYTKNCFFYRPLNKYMLSKIYYDTFRLRLAAYYQGTSNFEIKKSKCYFELIIRNLRDQGSQIIFELEQRQQHSSIFDDSLSTVPTSSISEQIVVLYRGIGMNENNFNELKNQQLIFLQMFSSTSRRIEVAKMFAMRSTEPIKVIFELQTNMKHATNIKECSQIPGEEEWILDLNIQFNITSIEPMGSSQYLVKAFVSELDQEELDYNKLIEGAHNRDFNIFIKLIGFFNKDEDLEYIQKKYQFKDENQRMYISQQISQLYLKNNQFDKLLIIAKEMLATITPETTDILRLMTYRFYSQALQAYGDFEESEEYMQRAVELAIRLKDKILICLTQQFLGMLYLNYNKLDAAQSKLEPSYRLYVDYKSKLTGKQVDVLVANQYPLYMIFMNRHTFEEKRKLIKHLQYTKNQIYGKQSPITAQNKLWSSLLYLYNKDYDRAIQDFNDSAEIIEQAGDNWINAQILGLYIQGQIFDHQQEYDKSSQLILTALKRMNNRPKFAHQVQLFKVNNRHIEAYGYRELVFNRITLSILQYFEEYKKVEEVQRNNMNFQPQPLNIFGEVYSNQQDELNYVTFENTDQGFYDASEFMMNLDNQ